MSTLNGRTPADSFPALLKINRANDSTATSTNPGIDSTLRNVEDGLGNQTPLKLSSTQIALNDMTWPTSGAAVGKFLQIGSTNQLRWLTFSVAGDLQWNSSTGVLSYSLGFTPVNKAGDTMTGFLTLSADPTSNLHAATKAYVDSKTAVQSVNTKTGAVTLTTTDISEGTNLYFTNARTRSAISASGTGLTYNSSTGALTFDQTALSIAETQIPNGSILARVADNEVISGSWTFTSPVVGTNPTLDDHLTTKIYVDNQVVVGSPVKNVNSKTGDVVLTTTDISEGSNQYFTIARARSSLSGTGTGLSYNSTSGVITFDQTALNITESQITNGTLLARLADNETITGTWTFSNPVSGANPVAALDLATKQYVDNYASGIDFKQSVRAATTGNITLSGLQTVDGVTLLSGDRVLVKDQSTASQNGIYVAASGSWSRAYDADNSPNNEVNAGMFCFVQEGTVNADTGWVLATNNPITLGTTALNFVQFSGAGLITAGNGLSKTGNILSVQTVSSSRIAVSASGVDLATVTDSGTGSFKKITVDSYGRVSGTTSVTSSDITTSLGYTPVNKAGDTMTGGLTAPTLTANTSAWLANMFFTSQSGNIASGNTTAAIGDVSASLFTTVKYMVTLKDTTTGEYETTEILLVYDGTNINMTQFGTVLSGVELGTFSATIASGQIRLTFTKTTSNAVDYKTSIIAH